MVDYDFYVNCYMGSAMDEKTFAAMAVQAKAALERLERCYQVSGGENARNFALCAMAETFHAIERRRSGMSAASVGEVSVRYETPQPTETTLWRELYRRANIYLDIYRGVAQ